VRTSARLRPERSLLDAQADAGAVTDAGTLTVTGLGMPNGADYTFTWPAVGQDDGERLRLTLNANNQTHGGPYLAIIECDAPVSAGRFTIPREMVEAFPATEHWEACAGGDCPLP
jgi:hypothetical protein